MKRSVFVAGRGAVSSYGIGRTALIEGVYSGERGVRARERTLSFRAPTTVAGEFPAGCFDSVAELELPFEAGVRACLEALDEAGIADRSSVGLLLGTTKANLAGLREVGNGLGLPARLAHRIADQLGLACVHASVSTACTSGLSALAMAARRVTAGEVDRVLVLGVDAFSQFVMAGFGSMHILDPEPSRPFDQSRRGISLGEGAAAIVLSANERESVGIRIAGHGGANDACHVTGCDREGRGLGLAVARALQDAGLAKSEIDVMHLHGTGTEVNDTTEAIGLGNLWDGLTPPAFGTKGQTGHTLGAAGVVESVLAIAALERGVVPANVGLTEPGVDPRLNLTREPHTLARTRYALKAASGFGGIQQALIFEA